MNTIKIKVDGTTISIKQYLVAIYGRELFGLIYNNKNDRKIIHKHIRALLVRHPFDTSVRNNLSQEASKLILEAIIGFRNERDAIHKGEKALWKIEKEALESKIKELKAETIKFKSINI